MSDYWVTHPDDGAVMRIEKLMTLSRIYGSYLHDGAYLSPVCRILRFGKRFSLKPFYLGSGRSTGH